MRLDEDAGHGIGATRQLEQEQLADERSFSLWQAGNRELQPAAAKRSPSRPH